MTNARETSLRTHEMALWRRNSEVAFERHQTDRDWMSMGKLNFRWREAMQTANQGRHRGNVRGQADLTRQGEWGRIQKGDQSVSLCAFW